MIETIGNARIQHIGYGSEGQQERRNECINVQPR
jgi:hypothetical protein